MPSNPALALRYEVTIDGFIPLGIWTQIQGLSVDYSGESYEEGGENGFVHKIPGRAKYENVKLTRPIDQSSMLVSIWLATVQIKLVRQTAAITVLDSAGSPVTTWNLIEVFPVRWSGPSLDINGNQLATETLELAHNGFIGLGQIAGGLIAGGLTAAGNF
jgi:phage tail-like protein